MMKDFIGLLFWALLFCSIFVSPILFFGVVGLLYSSIVLLVVTPILFIYVRYYFFKCNKRYEVRHFKQEQEFNKVFKYKSD